MDMLIGFLYQFNNASFQKVEMKAKANVYHDQVSRVFKNEDQVVGRWTVYRKPPKDETLDEKLK
jgi:hypothetical protein